MTERDPDAERGEEPERQGPEGSGTPLPPEEEAAWAAIVAGYGKEPDLDEPAAPSEDGAEPADETERKPDGERLRKSDDAEPAPDAPSPDDEAAGEAPPAPRSPGEVVRSFTVYAPGTGPRDWSAREDPEDDHFVPPEPPPLPETDTATKFAWLGAVGGPLLLIGAAVFGIEYTWWLVTLGFGGFIVGFGTLLTHLRDGDDEGDDPGGGAVV